MSFLDFLFKKENTEHIPADGYLAHPPRKRSIINPGRYKYSNREVEVLGFAESGTMHATLFLCHEGKGCCSRWGTLEFHLLSQTSNEEIWECTVGLYGIVIHAVNHGSETILKIEVDK